MIIIPFGKIHLIRQYLPEILMKLMELLAPCKLVALATRIQLRIQLVQMSTKLC